MVHRALVPPAETFRSRNDATDPRVGDRVRPLAALGDLAPGEIVLLGVRNEQGVLANHGRPGAAQGPDGFRRAFFKLTAPALQGCRCWDAGDLPEDLPYGDRFALQGEVIAALVGRGALPLVVGGGHDCSYGNHLGLAALGPSTVIGVDAHLDVRPEPGPSSGNPFRRMLEQGLAGRDLTLLGLVPWVNAQAHRTYAETRGVALHDLEPGQEASLLEALEGALARAAGRRTLATLDLDAFSASALPGVSAPNPWGLSLDLGLQLARRLGASPCVAVFDLMELAPPLDPSGISARSTAFLAAAFLQGFAARAGTMAPGPPAHRSQET